MNLNGYKIGLHIKINEQNSITVYDKVHEAKEALNNFVCDNWSLADTDDAYYDLPRTSSLALFFLSVPDSDYWIVELGELDLESSVTYSQFHNSN